MAHAQIKDPNDLLADSEAGIDKEAQLTGARAMSISTPTNDVRRGFAYDGDAFIVRHAYFTGADDPYDKLRRALNADISDEAWATINSMVSRAFPRPRSGRIAIKVINHYGDEAMKVVTAG